MGSYVIAEDIHEGGILHIQEASSGKWLYASLFVYG